MTTELLEVKEEFHAFTDYRAELMDAVDEGRISPELMIISLIKYMSQDDVKDCLGSKFQKEFYHNICVTEPLNKII